LNLDLDEVIKNLFFKAVKFKFLAEVAYFLLERMVFTRSAERFEKSKNQKLEGKRNHLFNPPISQIQLLLMKL
jgi:hypothetical protein